jgi:integrase
MVRKKKALTDDGVKALPVKRQRYAKQDTDQRGLYIRITPNGVRTFYAVTTDIAGKVVWTRIGDAAVIKTEPKQERIDAARAEARRIISAIKSGKDRAGPQSFDKVAEQWLKRHVEAKGLRSAPEIKRYLKLHVLPSWAARGFTDIKRGDVAKLLDAVEDNAGPVAADKVLAHLSGLFNWYVARHDDYVSPVVKGMRRSKPSERARERILSDDELRAVWKAAESSGTYGALVRLFLLTGQRLDKVASMKWDDVIDGVWTIPAEAREKGNGRELVLPEQALAIINDQPRLADNDFVFPGRGDGHFSGFSKGKKRLAAKLPPETPSWQPNRDSRRTARLLMSRAGVRNDIAERVLGHAIKGVEKVYDRHDYAAEKAHALKALAGLIEAILNPPADNVRQLHAQ